MKAASPFAGMLSGFNLILRVLCARIAARGVGQDPLPTPLVLASHGWLARSLGRLAALVARFEAGRLGRPRIRITQAANPASAPPDPRPAQAAMPRGHGWLLPLVPMHAAAAGSQLQHLLAQPEMAVLIAGAPTLGRIMRPLARMLGVILPPALLLPPPAPRQRAARAKTLPPAPPQRASSVAKRDQWHHPPYRRCGFVPA